MTAPVAPLAADPALWDAFAEDRDQHPWKPQRRIVRIGDLCNICREPMRPNKVLVADAPGTRPYSHGGICTPCYQRTSR